MCTWISQTDIYKQVCYANVPSDNEILGLINSSIHRAETNGQTMAVWSWWPSKRYFHWSYHIFKSFFGRTSSSFGGQLYCMNFVTAHYFEPWFKEYFHHSFEQAYSSFHLLPKFLYLVALTSSRQMNNNNYYNNIYIKILFSKLCCWCWWWLCCICWCYIANNPWMSQNFL